MKKKKSTAHEDLVEVPLPDEMDDDTFLKHIEHRHTEECKVEGFIHRNAVDAWIGTYRAFHQRIHDIGHPGQYDHEHVEEEE